MQVLCRTLLWVRCCMPLTMQASTVKPGTRSQQELQLTAGHRGLEAVHLSTRAALDRCRVISPTKRQQEAHLWTATWLPQPMWCCPHQVQGHQCGGTERKPHLRVATRLPQPQQGVQQLLLLCWGQAPRSS